MAVYTTINDPSVYFQTTLYTGDGASSNATTNGGNSDLQPDWLWIKNRSSSGGTGPNIVFDSTRGVTKDLHTNNNEAEHTNSNTCKSFNTDGFTVGDSGAVNNNTDNFVAWQWKANGGTTTSNSNGTITSTVQANTAAGFSIISYTGNGTNGATIGHGLSQTPQIFFPKCLSTSTNWEMYYFPTGGTKQYGYLNLTNAFATWSYTAPTSTTIGLSGSGDSNGNGRTMIGYAFHSVQGYSKIGTYTGNGSADGTFVYTGFKPAYILIKCTNAAKNWYIFDNKRPTYNVDNILITANTDSAEVVGSEKIDFLSNGFKLRQDFSHTNASGSTYLYMAFASNPFVTSDGVPTTAR
tara:strand:- start:14 stop:1066 length:1053 start_codon:yes stop_codon:yes gene_type:complete